MFRSHAATLDRLEKKVDALIAEVRRVSARSDVTANLVATLHAKRVLDSQTLGQLARDVAAILRLERRRAPKRERGDWDDSDLLTQAFGGTMNVKDDELEFEDDDR